MEVWAEVREGSGDIRTAVRYLCQWLTSCLLSHGTARSPVLLSTESGH